jgi:hypothetical protein
MKIKKEYIVLFFIIVALAGYLYFKRSDRVHYDLPELTAVDTKKITKIEIITADDNIILSKKDDKWYIGEKEYLADTKNAEAMLKVFKDFSITDLVSDTGDYIRYDLAEQNRITVKAYSGSTVMREFDIGKTSPTYKHTFVKLSEDKRVYQAKGNFRTTFEITVSDLRDKSVLTFNKDEIKEILIAKGKKSMTLALEQISEEQEGEQTQASEKKIQWKDSTGGIVETAKIETLLSTLAALNCKEYLENENKADLTSPTTELRLVGSKEYSLALYAREEDETPAVSSENNYVFVLQDSSATSIENTLEELMKEPEK